MTVLSKILFGGLHVESYDLVTPRASGGDGGDAFEYEEERTGGILSLARSAAARAWTTLAGGSGRRHEAVSIPPREVKAATPSFMLTPSKGNVHAFKASVTCAVFDVLVRGRGKPGDGERRNYSKASASCTGERIMKNARRFAS